MKIRIKRDPRNPGEGEITAAFLLAQRPGSFFLPFVMEDGTVIELSVDELSYESGQSGMFILGGRIKGGPRYAGFYNAANHGPGYPDTEQVNLFGQPREKVFGPITTVDEGTLGARPR